MVAWGLYYKANEIAMRGPWQFTGIASRPMRVSNLRRNLELLLRLGFLCHVQSRLTDIVLGHFSISNIKVRSQDPILITEIQVEFDSTLELTNQGSCNWSHDLFDWSIPM